MGTSLHFSNFNSKHWKTTADNSEIICSLTNLIRATMSDNLEEYDMDQDKFMPGKGGKGRSKLEASTHTNHHDPSGQTRKIVAKMQNTEKNRVEAGGDKNAQKKVAPPAPDDD